MSILDFLTTITFLCIEATGITYTISILISFMNKEKTHTDEYSFIELFIAIFIALVLNKIVIDKLFEHNIVISICIFVFTIITTCHHLYALKLYKCVLISLICTLFPLAIRCIIAIILLDFNLTLIDLIKKPISCNLFCTGISALEASIALILKICNKSLDNVNNKIKYFAPQLFIIFMCLLPNMFFLMVNNFRYSKVFIFLNVTQMLLITMVSIFNLRLVAKQEVTRQKLENTLTYNKTLSKVNEGVRGFKHDMGNIVQAILGYIAINDSEGAKEYCKNLVLGFNDINTLSILSPDVIDDPGIYGIVVNKILAARENNMSLTLDITTNVSKINFPMFELSRTLGILLDNAIEAGETTEAKKLIIRIHHDYNLNTDVISISNSINDTNIDTEKIFAKDYSTKETPSGFGLYEIKKFMKKYTQGNITTTIDEKNKLFTQTLTICSA